MFFVCFLSFIIILNLQFDRSSAANDTDYCAICLDHTLCIYRSGPSPSCGPSTNVSLSEDEITAIVTRHNSLRQRVADGNETRGNPGPQPAATDMKLLKWDEELATIAQRWANQCLNGHDACRNVKRFIVGQNVMLTTLPGNRPNPTVSEQIQTWYSEVASYDRNDVSSYRYNRNTGEYTQLVWGNTTLIGCGRIIYTSRGMKVASLICNYGTGGNVNGQPVYQTSP